MLRFCTSFAAVTLFSLVACGQDAASSGLPAPVYKSTTDQVSYGIGMNIGRNLMSDGLKVNMAALTQGINDVLTNAKPRLTEAQISAAFEVVRKEMEAKAKTAGEKSLREGRAFLAANKAKQGITTLPSGLQYAVLKRGNGPSPKVTDTVRTHYHGTFISGKVFDSSVESNKPATFQVGGVIRGWTEALQLMKVGSKWRLFVPSELAYGPQGQGPIGPHTVLIFDVELLAIE